MAIEKETINDCMVCRISGGLNIWEAGETWQQFLPLLNTAEPLCLDLSGVDECDGSGIQFICQLRKVCTQTSKPFQIEALSQPVADAMTQAGLDPNLFTKQVEEK